MKKISQAFDPEKIFLADRFIKGECPRCGAKDQYGDNCEICGSTYDPSELKNPVSIFSGARPILKESEHYFFKLEKHHQFLNEWINSGHLPAAVANKMQEWLKDPLKEWDIFRDQPYFGFEIPNAPGKYFYVWLEAPIGYIACLKKLSKERTDVKFEEYWQPDTTSELYHFIGKGYCLFPGFLHFGPPCYKAPTCDYQPTFSCTVFSLLMVKRCQNREALLSPPLNIYSN